MSSASTAAPLLAYTESAQRQSGGASIGQKKKKRKTKDVKPKTAKVLSALAEARKTPKRRRAGTKEAVAFDEEARREYLTGFSKRKTERKEAARRVIEERQKRELRESRNAARQERKKQAAENVKAERTALGLEDDDDRSDDDDEPAQVAPPAEFESEGQHAVVTVESFDPDDPLGIDAPPSQNGDKAARKRLRIADSTPASSRRANKKAHRAAEVASADTSAPKRPSKKSTSSAQERVKASATGAGAGHGAGRLSQRKQAAKGLTTMLESSSRKAKAVS